MAGKAKAPDGLGNAGRALWRQVSAGLPDEWEFDERERAILFAACRQRDDVSRLESAIKADGVMSVGSQGQPVVNPAVVEARQGRLALGRLLGQLDLPDADEKPRSEASKRAQRAANVRWGLEREKEARRGKAR